MMLDNLPENFTACVFGASGGIGAAITRQLSDNPRCGRVWAGARQTLEASGKVAPFTFDLEEEASIAAAAEQITAQGDVHLVFAATGVLHGEEFSPERSWRELDPAAMARVFALNAIGPALIGKYMLDHLPRDEPAIFAALSARVASIGDNRLGGWHSYRASKAALNMLIRNFAIELGRKRRQAACVALHPGTVDTGLSRPFQRNVPDGKLFSPEYSAEKLLGVLSGLTASDSGKAYAWDGKCIEW